MVWPPMSMEKWKFAIRFVFRTVANLLIQMILVIHFENKEIYEFNVWTVQTMAHIFQQ